MSGAGRRRWRTDRTARIPRLRPRRRRWCDSFSNCSATTSGARGKCVACSKPGYLLTRCRPRRRSIGFSSAMVACTRGGAARAGCIRAPPARRWSSPTRSGPRTSKANSAPAMACTAIRSPCKMARRASCSAAAACSGRPLKAVGPCLSACFAATACPPQAHLAAQQRCFDRFRERYNTERPHEALGDATPASCYAPSPQSYRARLPPLLYPGHYERRLVSRNGGIRWNTRWVNVSHLFAELEIGFEEIDDGLWNVYFGPVWLGRFHEEVGRIVDQLGRPMRRIGDNHKGRNHRKVLPIT